MKRITSVLVGSSLLLAGGAASAAVGVHDINTTISYPANPAWNIQDSLVGSDTLNGVMDALMATPGIVGGSGPNGYTLYLGLGSSVGERQVVGGTSNSGEPQCAPTDSNGGADNNPGCREIAPMSREMTSTICDDDHDNSAGAGGWTGVNTEAEGMSICLDGIVILSDNVSVGQYGNDSAGGAPNCASYGWGGTLSVAGTSNTGSDFPDRGVGEIKDTGSIDIAPVGAGPEDYQIGTNNVTGTSAWKDVLRLLYTGYENTQALNANTDNRTTRCNSAARQALIANWRNLFNGVDCGNAGNNCSGGLRKAYRRDDSSGTTGFFLEAISVAFGSSNLGQRSVVYNAVGDAIQVMPSNVSFCDGGHNEGWFPTNTTGTPPALTAKFDLGDPIRKNCVASDDLCAFDGKMPVVRSIKSTFTPDPLDPLSGYPKKQCTSGAFARKAYIDAVSQPVCPDGTRPNLAGCKFPYYTDDGGVTKDFDCINSQVSLPLTVPGSTDGRCYNFVMHQTNGTVRLQQGAGPTALPHVASWRENMVAIDVLNTAGKVYAAGEFVCREVDATRNIGCLVGKTTCTVGFAGREAAFNTGSDSHLYSEPVKLRGVTPNNTDILSFNYGIARDLWINAPHGFENLSDDCAGRGGTAADCADELAIATALYNTTNVPGNTVGDICLASGFVPLPDITCKGTTANAGCGAPTSQADSECQPF